MELNREAMGVPADRLVPALRRVATRRPLTVNAQAIVMLHPRPEENFRRLNDFIRLAHQRLAP